MNIYIIDDDLVSQFATRYCIEQYGENVSISIFANAEESLAKLSQDILNKIDLPDIIFLDLVMDDINGWEFIERLKRIARKMKLPEIYILSGFSNSKDRTIAKSHTNVSGYFDKPLTRNSLDSVFK